jgi:hypothetical protein
MAKVRTTITLDEGLWHRFQRVSELEDRSFSATVNGWLAQVVEPAEFVAAQIDGDKQASAARLRTLMGAVEVVNDQAQAALTKAKGIGRGGAAAGAQRTGGAGPASIPPPCNTGGKVPGKGSDQRRTQGGKAS